MKVVKEATVLAPNEATWRVGNWLSQACLVRPVAADTDIGIDLYCEVVQEERPFLHFWVQVKTGKKHIAFEAEGAKASFRFRSGDLAYWWKQPIPVFAFLVPPRGHPHERWLYVVDLTRWLLKQGGPPATDEPIESDIRCDTEDASDLNAFLLDAVPKTYAIAAIREGVSAFVPVARPSYEVVTMYGFRGRYHGKVVDQVRQTASATLTDLTASPGTPGQRLTAEFLAGLLELHKGSATAEKNAGVQNQDRVFTDHWEDYRALGLFDLRQGRPEDAKAYFVQAKQLILSDGNIDAAKPGWQVAISCLDTLIAKCDEAIASRGHPS
jgi:hypothetical protein